MDPKPKDVGDVSIGRSTAKMSGFILVSKVVSIALGGIGLITITRILGPGQYGVYIFATAAAAIFGALGDFGVSASILKFVPEHLQKKNGAMAKTVVLNGLAILFVLNLALAAIAATAGAPVARYLLHNPSYAFPIQLASLIVLTAALWNTASTALIAVGRGDHLAKVTLAQGVMQVGIGVSLALLDFGPVAPIAGVVCSYAVGILLSALLVRRQLGRYGGRAVLSLANMRNMVGFAFPLSVAGAVHTVIQSIGSMFLAAVATAAVLGNFGITLKVSNIFEIVVTSIGLAIFPLFSALLSGGKSKARISQYYNYAIYVSMLFVAPAALYIAFLSKQFTYVAFSGQYAAAPLYMAVMCIGVLLQIPGLYTSTLMITAGKTRKAMWYIIAMSLVSLALIPLLVTPALGGLGLTFIIFISESTIISVLTVRYAKREMKIGFDMGKNLRVVGAAFGSALFIIPLVLAIGNYYIPLLIAAFVEQVLIYPAALAFTGGMAVKDADTLRGITSGLPVIGRAIELYLTGYALRFQHRAAARRT